MIRIAMALLLAVPLIIGGCKEKTESAGKAAGEHASAFVKGVAQGVEQTGLSAEVRLSDDLKAKGVEVTTCQCEPAIGDTSSHKVSLYLINKGPVKGKLMLKALNAEGKEIGRTTAEIDRAKDEAKYVAFELEKAVPMAQVKALELSITSESEPAAK